MQNHNLKENFFISEGTEKGRSWKPGPKVPGWELLIYSLSLLTKFHYYVKE